MIPSWFAWIIRLISVIRQVGVQIAVECVCTPRRFPKGINEEGGGETYDVVSGMGFIFFFLLSFCLLQSSCVCGEVCFVFLVFFVVKRFLYISLYQELMEKRSFTHFPMSTFTNLFFSSLSTFESLLGYFIT